MGMKPMPSSTGSSGSIKPDPSAAIAAAASIACREVLAGFCSFTVLLLLRAMRKKGSPKMQCEAHCRSCRGWTAWFVIGTLVAVTACDRGTAGSPARGSAPAENAGISDVRTSHTDSRLMFQYRTQSSSEDCKAQAAEMPKVWDQIMKPHARNSNVHSVTLVPADPSGVSVSFEFTKSSSGQWAAMAPCSISIPIN